MGSNTGKRATNSSRIRTARKRAAKRRLAIEQERALEIGFLALAKEVAEENAETLRLLAKH